MVLNTYSARYARKQNPHFIRSIWIDPVRGHDYACIFGSDKFENYLNNSNGRALGIRRDSARCPVPTP